MKRFFIILFVALVSVGALQAQNTKANARKLFQEGKFEEAKPILKKLLKGSPNSAEYNYWYAACCFETGDTTANIEGMLQMAAKRRVLNAPYYLGRFYKEALRYPHAIESYEEYLEVGKDEDKIVWAHSQLEKLNALMRMMRSTERVCIIDSIIVDKKNFLQAYRMGSDVGVLRKVSDYFGNPSLEGVLSMTERGTDIYYPQRVDADGLSYLKLFKATKTGEEWGAPTQLRGLDTGGNDDYPFMSADGTTFYFASDGDESLGGYDIFITRYDSENRRFLKPTNIGMPFNSEANDYMMAVNEMINLGWFATDRRMPEGKVCIYIFIPNQSRPTYDYEKKGYDAMLSLSHLFSIKETQSDPEAVRKARQQYALLQYNTTDESVEGDFLFILDDATDYTTLANFKSPEAKKMFVKWQEETIKLSSKIALLEQKRTQYAEGNNAQKQRMTTEILNLEQTVEKEQERLSSVEKEIRRLELERLNRR